jgi:DNA-binding HxlR family transcriptional regulator
MALLDLLGRRWALRVLWELRDGASVTFRELQSLTGGVSASVLNDRLRELREVDIVEVDTKGYRLSADGLDLVAALAPLQVWVQRWSEDSGRA